MRIEYSNTDSGIEGCAQATALTLPVKYLTYRRIAEVALIMLLLPALLLIMLFISVPVFLCFKGKVIFRQQRVGTNGKIFTIYKFRTIDDNNGYDNCGNPLSKENVCMIGRFFRRHRFDELPQLLNVIKGDMSLIGPRPEIVRQFDFYAATIPNYSFRKSIPQGITGWSQVNYPHSDTVEGNYIKLKYDIEYINNIGFKLDMRIILSTIILILKGRLN